MYFRHSPCHEMCNNVNTACPSRAISRALTGYEAVPVDRQVEVPCALPVLENYPRANVEFHNPVVVEVHVAR